MEQKPDNIPYKKNTIKMARKEFVNIPTPRHLRKRRKSSIPLILVEFLKNNDINQIKQESSIKNSFKGEFSSKKIILKMQLKAK